MVKRTNTSKQNTASQGWINTVKLFFSSDRTSFVVGLIVAFLTLYVGLSMISFFFTGAADQSKIENVPIRELISNDGQVLNWGGIRGAFLADLLINRWFGVSSFIILLFFGTLGVKLMRFTNASLLRRFLFCAATMVWGSVTLAFIFSGFYQDSFLYVGGRHGFFVADFLLNNIGIPGTILLIVGSFVIICICASKRTVPFLQKIFGRRKRYDPEEEENNYVPADDKEEEPDAERENLVSTSADKESKFDVVVPEEEEAYDFPEAPTDPEPQPAIAKPAVAATDSKPVADPHFSVEVGGEGDDDNFDASAQGEYDPKLDLSSFKNPGPELLKKYDSNGPQVDMEEQMGNQKRIKDTLESFGISIASIKATVGPTVTLYEVVPETGVRISKIKNLEDDIALNLSALGIRIIAPMPGKGTIGIEVPNKDPQIVSMQSAIMSRKFQESKYDLPVVLGRTITNEVFMFDLAKMPHLLVAGATGQGKSVGLNAIITSLLYKKHPSELKFVLIDPKMVEFGMYSDLQHHYMAMMDGEDRAVITDCTKVVQTLNSLCKEMDDRYELLMKAHVRNIKEYNEKFVARHLNPNKGHRFMPFIVVIIDEYGDLMMQAGKEIELPIARIAQKARAVGIHMVIATQRPSTNIITGVIKANFPARMAFRVQQMIDSRIILDAPGANQLIGRGDLLFSQGSETTRVQCAFVDTPEVERIVSFISSQPGYSTPYILPEYVPDSDNQTTPGAVDLSERDPLFEEAARLIVIQQQGSTSLIQRKFAIGYNRAGRLMDQLEAAGIVGPFEGSKARQVLLQDEYSLEQLLNTLK